MPSQEQSDLPSPVAASEINRLHAKIFAALRTSIQDAIRIGELLSEERRRAGHGNWLPWIKANLEFSECTARNYIRVYENRDRLKSANVADLTDAYCLLADRNNALVPDTKCQPQQASFTQTNCTLFDVSVETLENFRVLVDRYLEELSKICDRADGFQDILEALFLYRWVMEETGNLPELFAEHESDLSLFMRELERDQESFRLLLPWFCKRAVERLGNIEKRVVQKKAELVPTIAALKEIRDAALFRQSHSTFEQYCQERWGLNSQLLAIVEAFVGASDA